MSVYLSSRGDSDVIKAFPSLVFAWPMRRILGLCLIHGDKYPLSNSRELQNGFSLSIHALAALARFDGCPTQPRLMDSSRLSAKRSFPVISDHCIHTDEILSSELLFDPRLVISIYQQLSYTIMDLKHWLLVVLQCCTISALVVDKPQAIATGSEDLQLPSPATLAHTNTTSLGAEAPQCRADLHGDPGLLSCRQALARMPLQPNREAMSLFTQRPPSKVAQKTSPWRIISRKSMFKSSTALTLLIVKSADGLCIIDVVLKTGAKYELANYSDLKDAATRLVRRCVQEERSGGSAAGYGKFSTIIH